MKESRTTVNRTKTVKVWDQPRIERILEISFPAYSRWITSDYSETWNRLDENGTLLSISKDTRDGTTFEVAIGTEALDYLDASYLRGNCSEAQFMDVFREMVDFVERAKRSVHP